jgi:hypothetical protein
VDDAHYLVDLAVETTTGEYEPSRAGRMATRFAKHLPEGSQPVGHRAAPPGTTGVATISVRVSAPAGIARALHVVATALEMTAAEEPEEDFRLGEIRRAVIELAED